MFGKQVRKDASLDIWADHVLDTAKLLVQVRPLGSDNRSTREWLACVRCVIIDRLPPPMMMMIAADRSGDDDDDDDGAWLDNWDCVCMVIEMWDDFVVPLQGYPEYVSAFVRDDICAATLYRRGRPLSSMSDESDLFGSSRLGHWRSLWWWSEKEAVDDSEHQKEHKKKEDDEQALEKKGDEEEYEEDEEDEEDEEYEDQSFIMKKKDMIGDEVQWLLPLSRVPGLGVQRAPDDVHDIDFARKWADNVRRDLNVLGLYSVEVSDGDGSTTGRVRRYNARVVATGEAVLDVYMHCAGIKYLHPKSINHIYHMIICDDDIPKRYRTTVVHQVIRQGIGRHMKILKSKEGEIKYASPLGRMVSTIELSPTRLCVYIVAGHLSTTLEFCLVAYSSISHILLSTCDMPVGQVAFDGTRIWATDAFFASMATQTCLVNPLIPSFGISRLIEYTTKKQLLVGLPVSRSTLAGMVKLREKMAQSFVPLGEKNEWSASAFAATQHLMGIGMSRYDWERKVEKEKPPSSYKYEPSYKAPLPSESAPYQQYGKIFDTVRSMAAYVDECVQSLLNHSVRYWDYKDKEDALAEHRRDQTQQLRQRRSFFYDCDDDHEM